MLKNVLASLTTVVLLHVIGLTVAWILLRSARRQRDQSQ